MPTTRINVITRRLTPAEITGGTLDRIRKAVASVAGSRCDEGPIVNGKVMLAVEVDTTAAFRVADAMNRLPDVDNAHYWTGLGVVYPASK